MKRKPKPGPKRQTAIRLDAEQLTAIEAMAERERRSVAAMIRILLDEALERRERS